MSAPLSEQRLAEIRDRWAPIPADERPRISVTNSSRGGTLLNALSHAVQDVPALLAEVARQAREIERLTAQIERRDEHAGQLAECLVARTEELIAAESRPSLPKDAPAVLLAKTLIEKFDDVVTATPVDATTLELNVEPADLARWQWWLNRVHAPSGQTTHRGSYVTAKGEFGRTKVVLTGLSVGSLYAAERDRNGGAS